MCIAGYIFNINFEVINNIYGPPRSSRSAQAVTTTKYLDGVISWCQMVMHDFLHAPAPHSRQLQSDILIFPNINHFVSGVFTRNLYVWCLEKSEYHVAWSVAARADRLDRAVNVINNLEIDTPKY